MSLSRYINNVSGLQFITLARSGTLILISIIFTKTQLSAGDIGIYETFFVLAGFVSTFWLSGVIQSLLPLYNISNTFGEGDAKKRPEFFNAFLLIFVFSIAFAFLLLLLKSPVNELLKIEGKFEFYEIVVLYIVLSNPSNLIEYIYLLKKKSANIVAYATVSFGLQLILVSLPAILGYDIIYSLISVIIVFVLRFIWLFVLLAKYSSFKISIPFIKEHLTLGYPLIITYLLSGTAQYVDSFIILSRYQPDNTEAYAIFRYGARELPLVFLMANALDNALIPEFNPKNKLKDVLATIKKKSGRLIYTMFPISIILIFISKWLFGVVYRESFVASAYIFNIYLLLIISRLVFPQTVLVGLKQTKIIMVISLIELFANISLSLLLVHYEQENWHQIGTGVAAATFFAFLIEKILMILYLRYKMGIKPSEYIPVLPHIILSCTIIVVYCFSDFDLIKRVFEGVF